MMIEEQREDWERDHQQRGDTRVNEAVAYTERENANLHKHVERLEKQLAVQVDALEAAMALIHPLSSFMGKESITEKKIKAALAAAALAVEERE